MSSTELRQIPVDALGHIASFLPLHDAVRMFLVLRGHNIVPRFAPLLDVYRRFTGARGTSASNARLRSLL